MIDSLIAIALAAAVLFAGWWIHRQRNSASAASVRPADNLDTVTAWTPTVTRVLSQSEREAYDVLRDALPAHTILAQVPLARFIKVPTRNSYGEWQRRVGHLCADLVVCDRHAQVIAVIEIKVSSEAVSERVQKRQQRLLRVLKAADVPVQVWSDKAIPSIEAVRSSILPPVPRPPDRIAPLDKVLPRLTEPALAVVSPFADSNRDDSSDEVIEMREPPSTWFDDMDAANVEVAPAVARRQWASR